MPGLASHQVRNHSPHPSPLPRHHRPEQIRIRYFDLSCRSRHWRNLLRRTRRPATPCRWVQLCRSIGPMAQPRRPPLNSRNPRTIAGWRNAGLRRHHRCSRHRPSRNQPDRSPLRRAKRTHGGMLGRRRSKPSFPSCPQRNLSRSGRFVRRCTRPMCMSRSAGWRCIRHHERRTRFAPRQSRGRASPWRTTSGSDGNAADERLPRRRRRRRDRARTVAKRRHRQALHRAQRHAGGDRPAARPGDGRRRRSAATQRLPVSRQLQPGLAKCRAAVAERQRRPVVQPAAPARSPFPDIRLRQERVRRRNPAGLGDAGAARELRC